MVSQSLPRQASLPVPARQGNITPWLAGLLSMLLLAAIGFLDFATGARTSFTLLYRDDQGPHRVPVALRLVGEHQVSNALAAAATGLELGLDGERAGAGIGRRKVWLRGGWASAAN